MSKFNKQNVTSTRPTIKRVVIPKKLIKRKVSKVRNVKPQQPKPKEPQVKTKNSEKCKVVDRWIRDGDFFGLLRIQPNKTILVTSGFLHGAQCHYGACKRINTDRQVRFKCSLTNSILDVLRARGWQEISGSDDEEWDFFWCDREWLKENYDRTYLPEQARICHFRNHFELTRKNLMVKNLKRMRKKLEKEVGKEEAAKVDFYPTTFELPSEYHMFLEEFKKNPGITWIMKPVAKSQGKGIFLFRKIKDIEAWKRGEYQIQGDPTRDAPETYVVSRYIDNPLLIGGRKFDIRVYVLVTSYNPLKYWLYRDGFARFSNSRFSLDAIDDSYVHLTNVAVQKTAPDYDPEKGCKWSVIRLREYMLSKYGVEQVEELFRQIDNIFNQSLHAVQKIIINDKHCFELYGYDILLDSNLKPWLLEVNASPSLTASSKEDYELKTGLLEDTLNIIDMEGRLTGKEKRVGGFDLIWDDGPIVSDESKLDGMFSNNFSFNSFLGCHNDRREQLKQLYRGLKNKANAG